MILEGVEIQGFQSYAQPQAVAVEPHLTLLAGLNNVGKSALLRALLVHAHPQDGARADFQITYRWNATNEEFKTALQGTHVQIVNQIVGDSNQQPLEAVYAQRDSSDGPVSAGSLFCQTLRLPDRNLEASGPSGRAHGWRAGPFRDNAVGVRELQTLAGAQAANILYLGPRRIEQGPRPLRPTSELAPDARNLSDVLTHLYMDRRYEVFEPLEEFMRRAFPRLKGLTISSDQRNNPNQMLGEPKVHFEDRDGGVSLQWCGTGVEQMLSLAVAVLSQQKSRLILIDEPQAYLHPHAEREMLGLIENSCHQFIIASHSHTLLRARPLSTARLFSLDDSGATKVAHIEESQQVLEALGITAADLWLTDRLLWVEGPSEERILALLAKHHLSDADRAALTIRGMPEASRFSAKSAKQAEAAYRFCAEVAAAISPLRINMRFLFDADEKSPDFRQKVNQVSDHRAVFLKVREIENYFLRADLLTTALGTICENAGKTAPSAAEVQEQLQAAFSAHGDTDLFPQGTTDGGSELSAIRGSAVLRRLWWHFALAAYDKVRDGERLTKIALAQGDAALDPLKEILISVISDS